MIARNSQFILLTTFILSALSLSQNVTFNHVKIRYAAEDDQYFTAGIISENNLKNAWNTSQITGIAVLEGSLPIIYPDSITNFPVLKYLVLSRSGIEQIHPGAFENLPVLKSLKLSENKLTTIEAGVFSNLNLLYLNLDQNLIETISPHAFDNMTKLTMLDLNRNQIKIFHPEWLQGKPLLGTVRLGYNQIEHLPSGAFANYHKDAHLNNNKIKSVSRDIFGSDDNITFGNLWFSRNEIEEWKEDFVKGAKIKTLDMSRNKLQCLEGKYENFFVARHTRIDDNPWNCECFFKVEKWAVQHQREQGVDMAVCARVCHASVLPPRQCRM
ncbi:leucine-rich repeat-containing G-protein coupled receptor 4-like [Zophobas morio]|uniref:leucine-rich repeat-containing G-protein coupled receptor 4-like n=1 Tax=Zophobas morio TaxID=2755281 RepID=UPI0030828542